MYTIKTRHGFRLQLLYKNRTSLTKNITVLKKNKSVKCVVITMNYGIDNTTKTMTLYNKYFKNSDSVTKYVHLDTVRNILYLFIAILFI